MTGPSFAQPQRQAEDMQRSKAADLLEIQDQIAESLQTTSNEHRQQGAEADKVTSQDQLRGNVASLESRLQGLEHDKISHGRHLQRLDEMGIIIQGRLHALEEKTASDERQLEQLGARYESRLQAVLNDKASLISRFDGVEFNSEFHLQELEVSLEAHRAALSSVNDLLNDQVGEKREQMESLDDQIQAVEERVGARIQALEHESGTRLRQDHAALRALERRISALEDSSSRSRSRSSTSASDDANHETSSLSKDIWNLVRSLLILQLKGLKPYKLDKRFPGVFFVIDPWTGTVSDGSDLPATLSSALRTILSDMFGKEKQALIPQVRDVEALTSGERCLYAYLTGKRESVWTKEFSIWYACRACVNTRILCMLRVESNLVVLPLHPLLRTSVVKEKASDDEDREGSTSDAAGDSVHSSELGYWVSPRMWMTRKPPYNVPIWSK